MAEIKTTKVCRYCRGEYLGIRISAFCSRKCSGLNQRKPLAERFWAKVARTDSCWLWTGGKNSGGYGIVHANGCSRTAHRVSWELENGPLASTVCVLHRCDTPLCVRTSHLFLGDYTANNRDREAKGRGNHPKGPDHWTAKRTVHQG